MERKRKSFFHVFCMQYQKHQEEIQYSFFLLFVKKILTVTIFTIKMIKIDDRDSDR